MEDSRIREQASAWEISVKDIWDGPRNNENEIGMLIHTTFRPLLRKRASIELVPVRNCLKLSIYNYNATGYYLTDESNRIRLKLMLH